MKDHIIWEKRCVGFGLKLNSPDFHRKGWRPMTRSMNPLFLSRLCFHSNDQWCSDKRNRHVFPLTTVILGFLSVVTEKCPSYGQMMITGSYPNDATAIHGGRPREPRGCTLWVGRTALLSCWQSPVKRVLLWAHVCKRGLNSTNSVVVVR